MSIRLAACATKFSSSASCEKTLKAAGCAMTVRRKRGHTDARRAHDINQPLHLTIAGGSWKLLSTPAAGAAKRASNARGSSQTTGRWRLTRGCVRNARHCATAKNVRYATKRWRGRCSLLLNGMKHHRQGAREIGSYVAPPAIRARAAMAVKEQRILPRHHLSADSAVPSKNAQFAASCSGKLRFQHLNGNTL